MEIVEERRVTVGGAENLDDEDEAPGLWGSGLLIEGRLSAVRMGALPIDDHLHQRIARMGSNAKTEEK